MAELKKSGSHVDFIALHHYESDFNVHFAVHGFRAYVQRVYDMYHLPIWVTEYAMVNYTSHGWHVPDSAVQAEYARASSKMLQSLHFVERFAWFALPESNRQPATNLYDSHGNITPVGLSYMSV